MNLTQPSIQKTTAIRTGKLKTVVSQLLELSLHPTVDNALRCMISRIYGKIRLPKVSRFNARTQHVWERSSLGPAWVCMFPGEYIVVYYVIWQWFTFHSKNSLMSYLQANNTSFLRGLWKITVPLHLGYVTQLRRQNCQLMDGVMTVNMLNWSWQISCNTIFEKHKSTWLHIFSAPPDTSQLFVG